MQENDYILIKEAERRSTVVIFNKTYYTIKIQQILKDEINAKLDNDIT